MESSAFEPFSKIEQDALNGDKVSILYLIATARLIEPNRDGWYCVGRVWPDHDAECEIVIELFGPVGGRTEFARYCGNGTWYDRERDTRWDASEVKRWRNAK
jgi:hypothetical protein